MAKINQKLTTINDALQTLQESIELFHEYQIIMVGNPTAKNEQLFLAMRDSMIRRFEYCTDPRVLSAYQEYR